MGRGFLYEVIGQGEERSLDAESYMEGGELASEFSFLSELEGNGSDLVRDLVGHLEKCGATVQLLSKNGEEDDEDSPFAVVSGITHEVKKNYFAPRLDALRDAVAEISLDVFADDTIPHNTPTAYTVAQLADATNSDAVIWNGMFMTMDDFIRGANPDRSYYFGNVLVMNT